MFLKNRSGGCAEEELAGATTVKGEQGAACWAGSREQRESLAVVPLGAGMSVTGKGAHRK